METTPPGKNHHHRVKRGSVKARLARENPFQFALLYHDPQLAQEMRQRRIEETAMWQKVDACCVVCHALLIHAAAGIFYCPYARAGIEDRARENFARVPHPQAKRGLGVRLAIASTPSLKIARSAETMTAQEFAQFLGLTESHGNPQAWGDEGLAVGRFQVHPSWVWQFANRYKLSPTVRESWDHFIERIVVAFFEEHTVFETPVLIAMRFHLGHQSTPADDDYDQEYARRFQGFAGLSQA